MLSGSKPQAENLNPGGSVKDRAAKALVLQATGEGAHTVVEGTGAVEKQPCQMSLNLCLCWVAGGNTGVGLAMAASAMGLKSRFAIPQSVSQDKVGCGS